MSAQDTKTKCCRCGSTGSVVTLDISFTHPKICEVANACVCLLEGPFEADLCKLCETTLQEKYGKAEL